MQHADAQIVIRVGLPSSLELDGRLYSSRGVEHIQRRTMIGNSHAHR